MKKVVSLLLVMLMVLGMGVSASALTQIQPLGRNAVYVDAVGDIGIWGLTEANDLDARPGDTYWLPLHRDMFDDAGYVAGAVTSTFISSKRISARIAIAAGRQGVASVELVYDTFGDAVSLTRAQVIANYPALDAMTIDFWNYVNANPGIYPVATTWATLTTAQKNDMSKWFNNYYKSTVAITDALRNDLAKIGDWGFSDFGSLIASTSSVAFNNANNWLWRVSSPNKTAAIKIKMVRPFVSVDKVDLDFTVYLLIDGKRQYDYEYKITGELKNFERDTFADTTEFDGYTDQVAVAQEYAKLVRWDCDNGVFIYTKLFKGKKYYGISTREADERDDVVFAKYPDIDGVYNMLVVGLNSTTDYVRFEEIGGDYYVYDKDLNYLGMSSDKLKFSSKYYISNKKLDIQGDDTYEEPDDDGEEPEDPPITGGNEYPSNVNDNPGTGR